jgi:hypothetical protein
VLVEAEGADVAAAVAHALATQPSDERLGKEGVVAIAKVGFLSLPAGRDDDARGCRQSRR